MVSRHIFGKVVTIVPTVSPAVDDAWAKTLAGSLNGLTDGFVDLNGIIPVDGDTWDSIAWCQLSHAVDPHHFAGRNGKLVAVALADVNDGYAPERSEVDTLMEGAGTRSTLTEESQAD